MVKTNRISGSYTPKLHIEKEDLLKLRYIIKTTGNISDNLQYRFEH